MSHDHLVGGFSEQFGLVVMRPFYLSATLFDATVLGFKNAVHRSNGTVIGSFIEQAGIDLVRGGILKSLLVQGVQNQLSFIAAECQWG
jgi:hypothetical protein